MKPIVSSHEFHKKVMRNLYHQNFSKRERATLELAVQGALNEGHKYHNGVDEQELTTLIEHLHKNKGDLTTEKIDAFHEAMKKEL